MINKIGKITIYVKDQSEAKKFWTEKLGFVCTEQPMGPSMVWMEVKPSEEEFTSFVIYNRDLMLSQNPKANVEHPSIILSTTDIESAYNKMKEKEVEVDDIINMPYGKMVSFKDQDGNAYLLREDK